MSVTVRRIPDGGYSVTDASGAFVVLSDEEMFGLGQRFNPTPERAYGVFGLLGLVIGFTLLLAVLGGVAWLAIEAWSAVIP